MDQVDALRIILEMAMENVLEENDDPVKYAEQQEAIETVEQLIINTILTPLTTQGG